MTNFEKHTDELCKILSYFVGVSDDKPRICNDLSCKNCDFDDYGLDCIQEVEDWLKKEVTKRPMVDVPDMNVGKCSEFPNNSTDCIRRQDAIDVVDQIYKHIKLINKYRQISKKELTLIMDVKGAINQLPSAQPEIIHCKDCKHWIDKSCESDDMWMSMYEDVSAFTRFNTDEDFFCRFAERREK